MSLFHIMSEVISVRIHRYSTDLPNLRRLRSPALFHLLENHLPWRAGDVEAALGVNHSFVHDEITILVEISPVDVVGPVGAFVFDVYDYFVCGQ